MSPRAFVTSTTGSRSRVALRTAASAQGEALDSWELDQLVASGAFSQVYRARPLGSAGLAAYAIKRAKPAPANEAFAAALLRRELRVAGVVSHPHLVAVLDARVDKPPYYLVMPWLEGATLATLAARKANLLTLPIVLWIARQVAEALAALDHAGWVHGDLKPANIMVSPTGHATLLDLGLARRPADEDRAHEQQWIGTPLYMAPETVLSVARSDIRSDIYSLGAILYELLAGRPPYPAGDARELIAAHRQAEPVRLRELCPNLPKRVDERIHSMLAKEPLRRPQSPRELVRLLVALEIEHLTEE